MSLDKELGKAALAYAAHGRHVLPLWWPAATGDCACGLPDCDSAGKHPIPRLVPARAARRHQSGGDRERMVAVGPACQHRDPHRSGERPGRARHRRHAGILALQDLIASNEPLWARWARTGSGGWHAYLAHPVTTREGGRSSRLPSRRPPRRRARMGRPWVGPSEHASRLTGTIRSATLVVLVVLLKELFDVPTPDSEAAARKTDRRQLPQRDVA